MDTFVQSIVSLSAERGRDSDVRGNGTVKTLKSDVVVSLLHGSMTCRPPSLLKCWVQIRSNDTDTILEKGIGVPGPMHV